VRAERDALQCTLGLGGIGEREEKRVESTLEFGEFRPGKGETEDRAAVRDATIRGRESRECLVLDAEGP
jgi:hypothetical protein